MLPVMSSNSWFPTMFDEFFNNDWMPKMKATAPAINVKENGSEYTMEFAVPGIKKEFCRVSLNNEGNLLFKYIFILIKNDIKIRQYI